ncbi:MAG: DUF4398 domain-containing protein [candidate division KSB1 bacterium]|nr:DUF4398 domain-containing protein [candidate division KSB1 bacterium]MDZ7356697.1 DUF4398 domain-containing protein [candidate division KSB1 bacterium]MDZ7375791.1 DUF4398 domain-containing protein [candidate division KSB1 bacterium]MDZ7398607.1 DUF4398 domain-containing protein [candidate division KSB1 bacterium]
MNGELRLFRPIGLFFFLIIFCCTKQNPQRELNLAAAAIDSAMSAKANYFAPKEFELARDAYLNARKYTEQKKFDKARQSALMAIKFADSSIVISKRKKLITEIEIEQLISYLRHKIDVYETVISKAENYGIPSAQIDSARAELDKLNKTLVMMIIKNDEEDYETIRHECNIAIEQASLATYQLIKLISSTNLVEPGLEFDRRNKR